MKPVLITTRLLASAGLAALVLSAVAGCLVAGTAVRKDRPVHAGLDAAIRDAWKSLGSTNSRCDEFDYFPGGGMRNFYCHLLNYMDYRKFAEMIGMPVFIGGPHSPDSLVLDSRYSFGRYNPQFVSRLGDVLVPGSDDGAFRAATQGVYDASIRPLARVFFVTYRKLMDNQAFLVQEKNNYLAAIRARTLDAYDYEKYFDFLNCEYPYGGKNLSEFNGTGYEGICDGNVVKTCVAFWIRRSIDGTADEFYRGLEKLLVAYDGGFLRKFVAAPEISGTSSE